MSGAVIIPAHNEEAIIRRTLNVLTGPDWDGVDIIVVANGCSDATASRARAMPGVQVLEIAEPSKAAALNLADDHAVGWPRLYLDADILISRQTVDAVFEALDGTDVLAARPAFRYDTAQCRPLVRSYYRARQRIPGMGHQLWGAGAYALSEAGHARVGRFPALLADDLYVDQRFDRTEISIVSTDPVLVRCPRTVQVLVKTLRRVYSGQAQVSRSRPVTRVGGLRAALTGARDPRSLVDAVVYVGIAATARLLARRQPAAWHRDDTNRVEQEQPVRETSSLS